MPLSLPQTPSDPIEVGQSALNSNQACASINAKCQSDRSFSVGLFLVVMAVYFPSLFAQFIWDDDDYVTKNLMLRTLEGLWKIWTDPRSTPQYYPFVHTSFWIEYHLWKLNPAGYHLINVILHAANAILITRVLCRLNVPGAKWTALVFALHPVHVESVSWITERKNVLSAFFYLASLLKFFDWWQIRPIQLSTSMNPPSRTRDYLAGFGLFVAALLSKSVTCSLPAVLLLILCYQRRKLSRRDWVGLAPLFAIGLVLALNTAWLERIHVGASGAKFFWTPAERVLIAGRAIWFYLGKLVWPTHLAFIYPRWTINVNDPWAWCFPASAVLVPLLTVGIYRRMTGPLLALLFFGGTLLPALGFFNIYPMRYSYVADHFQYLASLGMIALIVAVLAGPTHSERNIRSHRWVRQSIFLIIVMMLGYSTWTRQSVFQNLFVLWTDTIKKNPTSSIAYNNLGRLALNAGSFALAERHFREAHRYRIDDAENQYDLVDLAEAVAGQHRYPEAVQLYREALDLDPRHFEALNGWGTVLAEQGLYEPAALLFEKALTENPDKDAYARLFARSNLGSALLKLDRLDDAERVLREAVREAPSDASPDLIDSLQRALVYISVRKNKDE